MKALLAEALAQRVRDGDVIGLGSGTTTELALTGIAKRIADEGLKVSGIPTSHRTAYLATQAGIKVLDSSSVDTVEWAFDGADEVDPQFRLIKGRGGALLSEKIVASKAKLLVIVVTEEKLVQNLGDKFAIPIEVIPEAVGIVIPRLKKLGAATTDLRRSEGKYGPVVTEHGNFIVDAGFKNISNTLEQELNSIVGVVENGIFAGFNQEVLIAREGGVWSRTLVNGKPEDKQVLKK